MGAEQSHPIVKQETPQNIMRRSVSVRTIPAHRPALTRSHTAPRGLLHTPYLAPRVMCKRKVVQFRPQEAQVQPTPPIQQSKVREQVRTIETVSHAGRENILLKKQVN